MSQFRETILVRRISQRLARKCIFLALAISVFAGAQAIFAESNELMESISDLAPFSEAVSNWSAALTAPATTNNATVSQAGTNVVAPPMDPFAQKLATARYLRASRQTKDLKPLLVSLLDDDVPQEIQKSALLELAGLAQDEDDLPRAQQIYSQYLNRWPDDTHVPEVLLRQGRLFRQMGLHNLALSKFYAVMTAALTLKNDRLEYYEQLVVKAQLEIAETHLSLGKYADAAEYYSRLYKQDNPALDKTQILYDLIQCHGATTNYEETAAEAQDFLARYPDASQQPEVRFCLATALKALGRNNESLQQVLALLREQSAYASAHPEVWAYWRQRAGNLIANQFYREGDYPRALDVYTSLAQLDFSPQWQLPVWYQMGMTYEKLLQPQKAMEIYNQIITSQAGLGTNSPPNLSSIADMARWRVGFIRWQENAENVNRQFSDTNTTFATDGTKPLPNHE